MSEIKKLISDEQGNAKVNNPYSVLVVANSYIKGSTSNDIDTTKLYLEVMSLCNEIELLKKATGTFENFIERELTNLQLDTSKVMKLFATYMYSKGYMNQALVNCNEIVDLSNRISREIAESN